MPETPNTTEELYNTVRSLYMQLQDTDKETDQVAWRRAHIEADRYLMANKETLLPIIIDALGQQIRGVRRTSAEDLQFADGDSELEERALFVTLEDYLLNPATWPPPFSTKPSFLQRVLKGYRSHKHLPMVQTADDGRRITALPRHSVRLKDGRYGVVQVKHDSGLMEIQGPDGLFTATDDELVVSIAPPKKVKDK